MRTRTLVVALTLVLCGAWSASAQTVSVEFHDGKVRLVANNVPVSRILAEWARVGGTKIVNGERVPGPPVTLQLVDVTEQQAIDTLLRGAAGYMVGARVAGASGASVFDRILVLPTTTRVAATAAAAPAPPQAPQRIVDNPDDLTPDDIDPRIPGVPGGAPQPPRFPPARVPTLPPDQIEGDDQDAKPANPRPQTSPGNPFGAIPGSAQPGVVTPVTPRNPNNVPPDR